MESIKKRIKFKTMDLAFYQKKRPVSSGEMLKEFCIENKVFENKTKKMECIMV